ncbi:MAG: hypothetical protein LLG04_19025 [Parachlamydia sp.]|nr:hypothetical protein [Parachlamydia sp.]
MAGKKSGTDITRVQRCSTRVQFLNLGATILKSERLPDGSLVEIYQFKKEKGSTSRALMHGVLDALTGCTWELIGTPMELYIDSEEFITIRVTYGQNDTVLSAEFN